MLWLIEAVIGSGFLISVAISIESAAAQRGTTNF